MTDDILYDYDRDRFTPIPTWPGCAFEVEDVVEIDEGGSPWDGTRMVITGFSYATYSDAGRVNYVEGTVIRVGRGAVSHRGVGHMLRWHQDPLSLAAPGWIEGSEVIWV